MTNEPYTAAFVADEETAALMAEIGLPEGEVQVGEGRRRGGPGRNKVAKAEYVPREDPGSADLFNRYELPDYITQNYKTEKIEHRVIAFLKSQGFSNREIAERTGYSPVSVGHIVRLPWVRDLVLDEIKKAGRSAVEEVLSSSVLDSVHTLIDIRDSDKSANKDRIAAAKYLIDRVYGCPNQPITHKEEKPDLSKLSDEELAQIATKGAQRN